MREIPLLNSSTTAIVDDEDYNLVAQFEWCLHKEGHAQRWTHIKGDRNNLVKMHRFIMGSPIGVLIDHRNRNRLDNRRKNLRRATKAQNNYNCIGRPKRSSIYSRFKGVVWCRLTNKWRSQIGYQYKWIHIGRFATEEEAALAYNIKAVELFGEFALLNQL